MSDKVLTVAEEAIANADAYLNNAVLPTYTEMLLALRAAKKMVDEALPKFNWGASCLDANAIRLLNDSPGAVNRVLQRYDATMAGDFRFKG